MINSSILNVTVRNKERTLFSGQAKAISSVNDKGPFDILMQHENFITLIKDRIVVHVAPKKEEKFEIENGIIRVTNNKVFAYVNFKY